jgi:hypothetical protein
VNTEDREVIRNVARWGIMWCWSAVAFWRPACSVVTTSILSLIDSSSPRIVGWDAAANAVLRQTQSWHSY